MSQTADKNIIPEADDDPFQEDIDQAVAQADRQDQLLLAAGVDPWHLVAPCGTYEILPGDPDYKAARAAREGLLRQLAAEEKNKQKESP
jgi:hypothetical protein